MHEAVHPHCAFSAISIHSKPACSGCVYTVLLELKINRLTV